MPLFALTEVLISNTKIAKQKNVRILTHHTKKKDSCIKSLIRTCTVCCKAHSSTGVFFVYLDFLARGVFECELGFLRLIMVTDADDTGKFTAFWI
jgi:hypothetical protein